jgi:hypothetical protein
MKVYFHVRNDEGCLQEDVITLAEGLRELGIPFHANCNYWQETTEPGSWLFRHEPAVRPDDCDLVVVSYFYPYWIRSRTFQEVRQPLPGGLFKKGRKYKTVFMDHFDGHRTVSWEPEYRQFDLTLRAKLNHRAWHPKNMKPWVLGLNGRILRATEGGKKFSERNRTMLVNFGASHPYPHGTRDLTEKRFFPKIREWIPLDGAKDDLTKEPQDPYDRLMWRQTGGRYSRSYYERLKNSQAVACFCGEMIPPMPFRNPECYLVGGNKAKIRRFFYEMLGKLDPRPARSVQWDSFRFWEALAAGCVAFNIDLERYGVELPVMPEKWKHYIGINLENVKADIDRLRAEPECLERIATAGREWAMENYSPKKVAERLLLSLEHVELEERR